MKYGEKTDSPIWKGIMPVGRRNAGILPFQIQSVRPEIGTVVMSVPLIIRDIGHPERSLPTLYGQAAAVAVRIIPYYRPSVLFPDHRLKVNYASIGAFVLEVDEPMRAIGCIYPGTLVGAVYAALAGSHHDAFLIGPEGIICTQDGLPSGFHPTGGSEYVVFAIALVHLGSFYGGLGSVPIENHSGRPNKFCPIGRHGCHEQHTLDSRPRTGTTMAQIGLSILIPEGTGVDEATAFINPHRLFPLPAGVLGTHHKDSAVRIPAINVEPAVMIADCRSPYAVPVLNPGRSKRFESILVVGQGSSNQLPVDKVPGMQDRQPGEEIERGCRHIIVIPCAAHVGIGVIRMKDGIRETRLRRRQHRQQRNQKDGYSFHIQRFAASSNHWLNPAISPLLQQEPNQYSRGSPDATFLRQTPCLPPSTMVTQSAWGMMTATPSIPSSGSTLWSEACSQIA